LGFSFQKIYPKSKFLSPLSIQEKIAKEVSSRRKRAEILTKEVKETIMEAGKMILGEIK